MRGAVVAVNYLSRSLVLLAFLLILASPLGCGVRFGPQAWLQQNTSLGVLKASAEADAARAASQAEAANLKRKALQERAAPRMFQLRQQYAKSVEENQQLFTACALLKR